jgi:hypothetical protein
MHAGGFSQYLGEVVRQHWHELGAGLRRSKQGCLSGFGSCQQIRGHRFAVGHNDGSQFGGKQAANGLGKRFCIEAPQIIHFRASQYLYAVGMNEIEMADQRKRRLLYRIAGQLTVAALFAGQPMEIQCLTHRLIHPTDRNRGNHQALQSAIRACAVASSGAVIRASRSGLSLNICASSPRICRC